MCLRRGFGLVFFALIAQLEEHHFPKVGVAGSSPAGCTRLLALTFSLLFRESRV